MLKQGRFICELNMELITTFMSKTGLKGILHGFDKMFIYSQISAVQVPTLTMIAFAFFINIGASPLYNTTSQESCPESQGYVLHIVYTTDYKIFRCCKIVSCGPGEEIKTCTEDFGTDRCVQCESGYIQPDNITSKLPAECYYTECVGESKWTPMGCVCDTKQNYYGMDPYQCTYKECPSGQELLLDGSCVSPRVAAFIPLHILLTTKTISTETMVTNGSVITKVKNQETQDKTSIPMTTTKFERTTKRRESDKELLNINVRTVVTTAATISILIIIISVILLFICYKLNLLCFRNASPVRCIQKTLRKVAKKDVKEAVPLKGVTSDKMDTSLEWGTLLTDRERNRKGNKNLFKNNKINCI